jgi:DNA recombination protein RmuC
MLATDFDRFQTRMDSLAKRIAQAHTDVEQVHISSRKLSQRFMQIDKADFSQEENLLEETPQLTEVL